MVTPSAPKVMGSIPVGHQIGFFHRALGFRSLKTNQASYVMSASNDRCIEIYLRASKNRHTVNDTLFSRHKFVTVEQSRSCNSIQH